MAKLDARSILIILASFGLVAGTLILVQKRNGPPDTPASGPQSIAAPPSAPIELLGGSPAPAPAPAAAPAPVAPPASASSVVHHAIPAESSAPAPAPATAAPAKPVVVASSTKPASVAAPSPAGVAKNHAIPAESEPASASAAKTSAAKPVTAVSAAKTASAAAAPVRPASAPAAAKPAAKLAAPTGHYFLQAGAFRDENNAQKLIARLKSLGFKATESTVGELHKVLVGPYASSDAAVAAKTKLKAQGIDSAFVAKS